MIASVPWPTMFGEGKVIVASSSSNVSKHLCICVSAHFCFIFLLNLYLHQYYPSPQGRQLFRNLFQLWIVPQVQSFQAGQAGEGHWNVLESDKIMMMVMMVMIMIIADIIVSFTIIFANFTTVVDLESVL